MTGSGTRRTTRFLPLAMLAVATLLLAVCCDRPEPPPEDRPAGSRVVPPGGAVVPPGSPAELAHPLTVPEPPAPGPAGSPAAEKAPPAEAVVEVPAVPAAGTPGTPATTERGPETVPSAPQAAAPPPVAPVGQEPSAGATGTGAGPAEVDRPPGDADRTSAGRKTAREKIPKKQTPAPASVAPRGTAAPESPVWARDGEELSYKITFMGVTAGYARLISKGKVRIGERDAYHILIKAWTTGTLSVLFPISESFDYYLDTETLAPIRRDSVIRKINRPEIVLFDQERGTITHWYGDTMEVRKKKQIPPPTFYEGVSATYFFRTRGIGDKSVSIRVFGGRKVYRVSSERAGEESIPYGKGKVDTFLVKPLYSEEGGSGEKPMVGELLVWVSKDPRRVPVKVYASFKKGLEWRLVGELQSGLPAPK